MSETWMPKVGDWVIYDPAYGNREAGEVTEVVSPSLVRVLYVGDRTAKATHISDLLAAAPVRPEAGACACDTVSRRSGMSETTAYTERETRLAEWLWRHDMPFSDYQRLNPWGRLGTARTPWLRAARSALRLLDEDARLAEAWDQGYTSGHSRAMRRMSDEPNVEPGVNPYLTAPVRPEAGA